MSNPDATREIAPDFKLQDDQGAWKSLADFTSQGPVMLVFYPGDFTPVCTTQLCGYRDSLGSFKELGVQVVGVSADSPESHQKFGTEYALGFPLLSDPGKKTFKAYGATSLFMLGFASRATVIVSSRGQIVFRQVEATPITHRRAGELTETIAKLKSEGRL